MDHSENAYWELFSAQRENRFRTGNAALKVRRQKLKALQHALVYTYRDKIRDALYADFKKPFLETDLTEIYQVAGEIRLANKKLRTWMSPFSVPTPLALLGTSSSYLYEPKGVCLILSPWNFPVNLTFGPLVSAIAAGNTAVLKPSEKTPNSSAVMAEIVTALFPRDEVALVEGRAEVAEELLKLPFNHIFFTGSPQVGKLVMKAAAENLASVTLELGGKSPTIVDNTANLKTAAKRIAWGKFINGGQVCVSPDYLLVHEDSMAELVHELKHQIRNFYGMDATTSGSYPAIVDTSHHRRLVDHLEDARAKGARVEWGGNYKEEVRYLEPTLISGIPDNATLLREEIFGPILPILGYRKIEEAIDYINSGEKPLALYLYSNNRPTIRQVLQQTRAGSTAINTNVLQYTNPYLPFGGSNNSGIGKSHGFFGFQAFSNQRSVIRQHTVSGLELLFPPYTTFKQKLANLVVKWL